MPTEHSPDAQEAAGMHVLILVAPAGVFTYGPFDGRDGAVDFFNTEGLSALDPNQHTAIVNRIAPPVDLTATGLDTAAESQGSGPLRHDATDADHRANGYLVVLRDGEVAVAFGTFADRDDAEVWWDAQRDRVRPPMTAIATALLAQASAQLHLKNKN